MLVNAPTSRTSDVSTPLPFFPHPAQHSSAAALPKTNIAFVFIAAFYHATGGRREADVTVRSIVRRLVIIVWGLLGCGAPPVVVAPPTPPIVRPTEPDARSVRQGAETTHTTPATPVPAAIGGEAVLKTARRMMKDGVVIKGSCWDYANEVFRRTHHHRTTVFKGSRTSKRFADVSLIRPGDWLYYVNHQYKDVPHSAIFVKWLDRPRKWALMITYRGAGRDVPGVLDEYDLRSVYRIIRATKPK